MLNLLVTQGGDTIHVLTAELVMMMNMTKFGAAGAHIIACLVQMWCNWSLNRS